MPPSRHRQGRKVHQFSYQLLTEATPQAHASIDAEPFLEKLTGYLEGMPGVGRRESHSGPAKAAHDEAAAGRALERGLALLGVSRTSLERMPKNAPEKMVLAWWLRQSTTVSLRWLGEQLAMGHYTRVSQAISRVKQRPERVHRSLQRRLRCLDTAESAANGESNMQRL